MKTNYLFEFLINTSSSNSEKIVLDRRTNSLAHFQCKRDLPKSNVSLKLRLNGSFRSTETL